MSIIKRYKKLYSGLIMDVLDYDLMYSKNVMLHYKPLKEYKEPLVGYAFTCLYDDVEGSLYPDDARAKSYELEMFQAISPGDIHIISSIGKNNVAYYGEMTATFINRFGGVGCIVDGNIRDKQFLVKMNNFQVYCKGTTMKSGYRRWELKDYKCDVTLKDEYGQVTVSNGDLIFADNDGVIVIPNHLIIFVLNLAEKRLADEIKVRNTIKKLSLDELVEYRKNTAIW